MSDTVLEMAQAERDAINRDRIRLMERVAELEKENEKLRAALDNDGFRCDGCDIVEKAKEALRGSEKLKQRLAEAERERDAAVTLIGKLIVILKKYPNAATNMCAYDAYMEIKKYLLDMRGVCEANCK